MTRHQTAYYIQASSPSHGGQQPQQIEASTLALVKKQAASFLRAGL